MDENNGVSLVDRKLYHIAGKGLRECFGHPEIRVDLSARSTSNIPTMMVHGFRYDPMSKGDNNPHLSTFLHWRKNILKDSSAYGFGWWSCPGGKMLPKSLWKSFRTRRWNTYRHAWDLAEEAGKTLAQIIDQSSGPINLLCHSLGSRVVLSAIATEATLPINTVVLLNGAEIRKTAIVVSRRRPYTRFFNFVVSEDDVLKKFGALFAPGDLYAATIGQVGLGVDAPKNWRDINIDSLSFRAWAKTQGWDDVRGDNPDGYFDHWYTHKHKGNWSLIHALLTRGDLEMLGR